MCLHRLPGSVGTCHLLRASRGLVGEQWVVGAEAAFLVNLAPSSACGGRKLLASRAKLLSKVRNKEPPPPLSTPKGAGFHSEDISVADRLAKLLREKEGALGFAREIWSWEQNGSTGSQQSGPGGHATETQQGQIPIPLSLRPAGLGVLQVSGSTREGNPIAPGLSTLVFDKDSR